MSCPGGPRCAACELAAARRARKWAVLTAAVWVLGLALCCYVFASVLVGLS